jgi:hypothetical protein
MSKIKPELEEPRMDYAIRMITELGYEVDRVNDNELNFIYKDNLIKIFPYTGWHTGKGIKDGRGIHNLLKQITPK